MLTDYPVRFSSPEVRQTLQILGSVYHMDEIVAIVQEAGLPIGQVALHSQSDLTWRSVFQVAAGQGRVSELLDAVAARYPTLTVRLDELRGPQPLIAAEAPVPAAQRDPASPHWKNFSADGQAEAIIVAGQPTFVDVAFLTLGAERARSICRLVTRLPSGSGSGTGFRVGQRHVLTNHHVLFDEENGNQRATSIEAWFNYEDGVDGSPRTIRQIRCDPASAVGEQADDWALVTAEQPIPGEFPALSIDNSKVPKVDDRVYIIQHPGGGPKKVAFAHNLVRAVEPNILQYWTDTDLGSSGSPVFDERWGVVGLHHFSVPAPSDDRISVRNQGRRMDRVVERIRAHGALPELS